MRYATVLKEHAQRDPATDGYRFEDYRLISAISLYGRWDMVDVLGGSQTASLARWCNEYEARATTRREALRAPGRRNRDSRVRTVQPGER